MPVKVSRKKSKKTKSVSIRFDSNSQLDDIREAARKDGRSINQFVVRSTMTAVDKINAPESATPNK